MSFYLITKNDNIIDIIDRSKDRYTYVGNLIVSSTSGDTFEDCELKSADDIPIYRDKFYYKYVLGEYTKGNLKDLATYLYSDRWEGDRYVLETMFPSSIYDITITLDSDRATTEDKLAFDLAELVGSSSNVIRAYGVVPTIDIPIIIKVVDK